MRIFNTNVPNMYAEEGKVVTNFIIQTLRNLPIIIYGDGLIDGLYKLVNSNLFYKKSKCWQLARIYHKRLAELVIEITASKSKIECKTLPQVNPFQRKPIIRVC